MAAGYRLTGDKGMRDRCVEMLWWGLSRNYVNPPEVPEGEAPSYARIGTSTKDDWMTPTALAFGVCAHPKKDEVPPTTVADVKASSSGGGRVEIFFTAPADEGGGKVAKYQVKYAETPMDDYPVDGEHWRRNWHDSKVTVTYWNFAKNVIGEPAPQAAGKAEKFNVEIPVGKKYIAVRSFDDSHNRSKMSNVVEIEVK
jgi:hypothetical protein